VLALRPTGGGDLGVEHGPHHRHPSGHTQGQQPLPGHAGNISQREPDMIRQIRQIDPRRVLVRHDP
jgi:hypothetical protein